MVAEALAKVTIGFGYLGFSENLVPKKEKLIDIGFNLGFSLVTVALAKVTRSL